MPKKPSRLTRDPFEERESAKYDRPIASREYLLDLINIHKVPVSQGHITESLKYDDEDRIEALRRRLNAMVRDGQIFRNRRGGYLSFDHMDLEKGFVQAHADGFGFLTPESGGKDIFLPERQMRKLMNGDKAAVKIASYDQRRERSEGALISVLERAHQTVVGRYYCESGIEFIIPDDKRLTQDILLNRDVGHAAKQGDIVIVRITEYPGQHTQAIGIVEAVLGQDNAPGMEVTIAVNKHSIPNQWNAVVKDEVKTFTGEVASADKNNRQDLRKLPFVTIDGADARDFDDAVYCEQNDKGFRLYVAIADVAHYVQPGSALDEEAVKRGTSVYFPGEVIPMLPEVLSNGLCSLNPKVDRLCLVCCMQVSTQGVIKSFEFSNAVIHSHARLIYDDVAAAIFENNSKALKAIGSVKEGLENLKLVYLALAIARKKRHAIEFETREVVFKYNDRRKIESIVPVERNQAHMLIEECMVAANICAAKLLKKKKIPTLYRIHEGPNSDKLPNLAEFLLSFGIKLPGLEPTPGDYADIIEQARARPEFDMIQTVILRSMLQASYSPDTKVGHFGLALNDYAHFTSPIRRYPDLLVHRAIKHWIAQGSNKDYGYDLAAMTALGESCSRNERRADDATRDAADWLKCEFLQKHIGKQYSGIVSGVTSFGLFVQIDDLLIDGLVHVTSLKRDYYHFDPAHHRLVGELTNRSYQLGDRLMIEVIRVDMEERKIDFDLVATLSSNNRKPAKKGKRKHSQKKGKKSVVKKARKKSSPRKPVRKKAR
ncbi:MAG: ribonuclease R [Gammaproteobacteria bacterium]|nr:ribonuclease R [Gammaproteobacteria bacterium]